MLLRYNDIRHRCGNIYLLITLSMLFVMVDVEFTVRIFPFNPERLTSNNVDICNVTEYVRWEFSGLRQYQYESERKNKFTNNFAVFLQQFFGV